MIDNLVSVVGEDAISQLTSAFYAQVEDDDLLGPMYRETGDMAGAEERLRDFFLFRFGGPQDYLQKRGHPALRMRHARFAIDKAARDRWIELMDQAIDSIELPADAATELREFFAHVATFLMNK
jgi:hemoglobin